MIKVTNILGLSGYCEYCEREMPTTDSCLERLITFKSGLKMLPTPHYDKKSNNCPECGVEVGMYHHLECEQELCPRCGDQYTSCDCEEIFQPMGNQLYQNNSLQREDSYETRT